MFGMYDLCHPSYYKISQLGCTDGIKITMAFYVYMELCEVKCLRDVVYKYNKEIDIIYLEGKKSKSSEPEIYVPWPTIYKISLVQIENIQEHLKVKSFTFVFRGGDSTTVYYKATSGLVKPTSPDETKIIKEKEECKYKLDQEIRRNTFIFYEMAKSVESNENKTETANASIAADDGENSVSVSNDEKMEEIEQENVERTTDEKIPKTQPRIQKSANSQPTITSVEIISEATQLKLKM